MFQLDPEPQARSFVDSVGMEVFDRDDKYDPRVDSIVRVEAGRLRARLDEYYNGDHVTVQVLELLAQDGQ